MIFCCCVFTPPCAVCAVTVITASPVGNGGVNTQQQKIIIQ